MSRRRAFPARKKGSSSSPFRRFSSPSHSSSATDAAADTPATDRGGKGVIFCHRDGEGEGAGGAAAAAAGVPAECEEEERWSRMLPELLGDIITRVESSEDTWPLRKNVVSCACVCRRWREITMAVVTQSGKITFPSSLKQPGPRDLPLQCFIKRNKKNSTFYLYLSLTQCK